MICKEWCMVIDQFSHISRDIPGLYITIHCLYLYIIFPQCTNTVRTYEQNIEENEKHLKLVFSKHSGWHIYPDSKIHGANMGPTWVLSAPDGPPLAPWALLSGYITPLLLGFVRTRVLMSRSRLNNGATHGGWHFDIHRDFDTRGR